MSNLKARLRNGECVIGTMLTVFDNPDIVRMLKIAGFDYFIIDCEHGSLDYGKVAALFGMAKALDFPAIIRIPEVRREIVLKYMEAGACGLLLPDTDTAEQAKELVEYSKYAPMGDRGVSMLRPHTGYEKVNAVDYMKKANDETILMVQIESATSIKNINEILDVEGIDAAFIGPNDLSQSLGIIGQFENPIFVEAVEKVISAAKKKNKFSGIHLMYPKTALLPRWIKKGMTLNLWTNEVELVMNCGKEGLEKIKKSIAE